MALVPQAFVDALHRMAVEDTISADVKAVDAWLAALQTEVDARATSVVNAAATAAAVRASVAQTGTHGVVAADKGAFDTDSGTYNVTVPAAATLGDPWSYETLVVSGTASFVGGQATVPVTASGGGVRVRLFVTGGKVYLLTGTGATATWVA